MKKILIFITLILFAGCNFKISNDVDRTSDDYKYVLSFAERSFQLDSTANYLIIDGVKDPSTQYVAVRGEDPVIVAKYVDDTVNYGQIWVMIIIFSVIIGMAIGFKIAG